MNSTVKIQTEGCLKGVMEEESRGAPPLPL